MVQGGRTARPHVRVASASWLLLYGARRASLGEGPLSGE